jgi:hypothetical protein
MATYQIFKSTRKCRDIVVQDEVKCWAETVERRKAGLNEEFCRDNDVGQKTISSGMTSTFLSTFWINSSACVPYEQIDQYRVIGPNRRSVLWGNLSSIHTLLSLFGNVAAIWFCAYNIFSAYVSFSVQANSFIIWRNLMVEICRY